MYVDLNIVNEKMKQRMAKIETYASTNKVPTYVAAMFVDQNAPMTTNKLMLAETGFHFDSVTKDNFRDVIAGLEDINVCISLSTNDEEQIARALNDIINEPVNECWGGPDMQEFVDIGPNV